jgi:short-subunit dehydrogenase
MAKAETRSVQGKVVVITGASSGFGKGIARELARNGASVALAARRDALLSELAEECRGLGGRALEVHTDVSKESEVSALAARALGEFGKIDVWINNAGIGAIGRFDQIPLSIHVQVIETNLLGALYGSYQAIQQFRKQGHGILINVASELAEHTVPYYSSYSAAKHGIVGLDDSLRQEIEEEGPEDIHVCTVLPTAHDTPFFDHAANYSGHEIEAPKPLHDPDDVVQAIVRLVHSPKDRTLVGSDALMKVLLKRLLPPVSNKVDAKMMKRTIDKAPPAPASPGAVQTPMPGGAEVEAGRKKE